MSGPSEKQSSPSSWPRSTDPFELWRQIYETNERAWNAVLERTVNNPAFAESSGKILETFLSAQKTVRDNMRAYLEQINLPTREDIARLGELIVSLEEKVDQLDDRLANLERSVSAASSASAKMADRLTKRERSVRAARTASEQAVEVESPAVKPPGGRSSTRSTRTRRVDAR